MAGATISPLARQFVRFAAVGGIGTASHYFVLWLGVQYLHATAPLASAAGAVVGALVNYVLNYRFTFASDKPHLEAAGKFFAVAGIGLILNTALMHVLTAWLSWHYMLAQFLTTGLVLLWNFGVNRLWTFSQDAVRE